MTAACNEVAEALLVEVSLAGVAGEEVGEAEGVRDLVIVGTRLQTREEGEDAEEEGEGPFVPDERVVEEGKTAAVRSLNVGRLWRTGVGKVVPVSVVEEEVSVLVELWTGVFGDWVVFVAGETVVEEAGAEDEEVEPPVVPPLSLGSGETVTCPSCFNAQLSNFVTFELFVVVPPYSTADPGFGNTGSTPSTVEHDPSLKVFAR